jgi:hypothetical protein
MGVGAFTKSAKARILYIDTRGKVRADDCLDTVISQVRTNRNPARFPGPICQYARHWAQRKRARGGDAEASFCVTLREVRLAAAI